MPKVGDDYLCDVCGQPATNAARDVQDLPPDPGQGYIRCAPRGPTRYGCDTHRTDSVHYSVANTVLPRYGVEVAAEVLAQINAGKEG